MGAALLAGTAMFTACSSDEVIPENVNPTFDGESVKTQFAISIPAAGPKKKMTGDNTQQSGTTFLGMQNIRLIPYNNTAWGSAQALDKILALNNIETGSTVTTNETQKIYTDVDIPVGTDRFLFYGVAIGSDKVQNGSLIPTIDGQANRSDIKFELEQIHDGTTMTEQTLLVGLLNRVENTSGWSNYSTETTAEDKAIKKLYTDFITMKAGSASSILNLMQSLYRSLSFASNDGGASDAAKMAYAIRQAITTDDGGGLTLKVESGTSGEETLTYNAHEGFNETFPANYKLPDGAVRVKFADLDFAADNNSYVVGGSNNLKIADITYPASLYYFCESTLKASTSTNVTFPTNGNWGSEASWTGWDQTAVAATTRSIAMVSPVNYGVGMLATTVECASDNLIDAGDNTIAIGTNGFTLTGVLIGGQPDDVQWDMYQAYAGTLSRTKTIYDAAIPATNPKVTTTACDANYTLALDNSKFTDSGMVTRAEKDSQDKVNIAIELVNNTGKNFEGADGIIYAGSKFYLVAQLDPNGISVMNDDKKSVFMKDYKTTATLTISSLKNAYNGIPDLRSTSLQFGLAVNLEWQTGLSFDVSIE